MYQLCQLIPISNINNWCWSMQLKINWQVTVAQCNSNCSRIGIFSVYIIGVRLSDCLLTRLQPFATVQSCTVSLSRTVSSLLSHPIYIYCCWMYCQGSCCYDNLSTWSLTLCCGCDYCRSKNSCYITLWGWRLDDMGPRFISHLRTFWCTESSYFTSTQYPDGVRSVGIQRPESADLCWRKLNAW